MASLWNRQTAWLIALLAVLAAAWLSHVTTASFVDNEREVRRTMAVQAAIGDTLSLLKDAETGQRGFLLTGDVTFLEPYTRAQPALGVQLARLRELTRADPEQVRSFTAIERLAQARVEQLAVTIQLRREGQTEEALSRVRKGYGKRLMDAVRAESERMLRRETIRLAQRQKAAELAQSRTWSALGAALFVALTIAVGGYLVGRRDAADAARGRLQLVESERAFRSLADNAGDLVSVVEADRTLSYISPSCLGLLGYTPDEVLMMTGSTFLHADDRSLALEVAERARTTLQAQDPFVHRFSCKNGECRWFETRIQPALDQVNHPGRLYLTSRDVTARKAAEDELRTQTTRLESILTSMGDGVLVLDQDRRVVIVNPAAREYVRHDVGETISAAKWAQEYSAFLPDGVTPFPPDLGPLTRALRGEVCDAVEMILQDRAGQARIYAITARPLADEGVQVGCVGVYHDITEQRRAESYLAESERRWRALSEATFEGVAISQGGLIVDANEVFAGWLGLSPAELVGYEGLNAFAPEDREHVARSSTVFGSVYEARIQRPDGTSFPVEVRGRSATFNGQTVRVAVVRDVTEKKLREAELKEQAERLRSLSLRDELTGLCNRRGFLELARQQLRNVSRSKRAACLFYADLNGMKAINDGLGHEMGDRALVATAALLRSVLRDSDVVARLGGDEFAALACDCDAAGIEVLKHRLQAAIEAFNERNPEPFRLSISVGGALYDPHRPVTLETLMEVADAKMYEEKRGRSRSDGPSSSDEIEAPPLVS